MPVIPHKLILNEQLVGIIQTPTVQVELPQGRYRVTIQSMVPFLSASTWIEISTEFRNVLTVRDRERWWDLLFAVDLLLWVAELFFQLPEPWDLIYKIFTNGYFVVWLIYEWSIRKKYFVLDFFHERIPKET